MQASIAAFIRPQPPFVQSTADAVKNEPMEFHADKVRGTVFREKIEAENVFGWILERGEEEWPLKGLVFRIAFQIVKNFFYNGRTVSMNISSMLLILNPRCGKAEEPIGRMALIGSKADKTHGRGHENNGSRLVFYDGFVKSCCTPVPGVFAERNGLLTTERSEGYREDLFY